MNIYKKINPIILETLKKNNITQLYPPQEEGLNFTLNNNNVIISIPTASGKTLIAEITLIQKLLEGKKQQKRKMLYLCPLKALASEMYNEFRTKWGPLGIKIGYSIGDVDNHNFGVFKNDIIIMTNEKADSILRNRPEFIKKIDTLVIDEIHLINDPNRGITLEILITRIKKNNPRVQIIGLSATISNAAELARWLNAELVKSDWRPVELKQGFYLDDQIIYSNNEIKSISKKANDPIYNLVSDVLDDGGQCLVFVSTRKASKTQAEKLSMQLKTRYNKKELNELKKLSDYFKIISNPSNMTRESKKLILTMKSGVAFHNAALPNIQRKFIEDNFRKGIIRVLTATPTLAAGVNTPARRVIIKSLFRYDAKEGRSFKIPIMEYKQMSGRAGRPGFDPYGDSVILSSNPKKVEELAAYYIYGESESILSKLNNIDDLQIHVLGNIVMKKGINKEGLIDFLQNTFLSYQIKHGTNVIEHEERTKTNELHAIRKQINNTIRKKRTKKGRRGARGKDPLELLTFGDPFISAADLHEKENFTPNKNEKSAATLNDGDLREKIGKIIDETLEFLITHEFISKMSKIDEQDFYKATPFGRLTSKLYLKPVTAEGLFRRLKLLQNFIEKENHELKIDEITLIYIITLSKEIFGSYFRSADYDLIHSLVNQKYRYQIEVFTFDHDYSENVSIFDDMTSLKQACILADWIDETPESTITDRYKIGAGDLHRCTETAQWLARAIHQFSKLLNNDELAEKTSNLNTRIRYGIKEELIPVVTLKQIGRVRARILYRNGILSIDQLRQVSDKELEKLPLFSKKIIESIRNQLKSGKNNNSENLLGEIQDLFNIDSIKNEKSKTITMKKPVKKKKTSKFNSKIKLKQSKLI
ncbi:MAG: DEAD/DEAH box helicase [Promethearchaeota archaeon]